MIQLIIARHGNTFTPAQTPTRVGAGTDLPLVESGQQQAKKLGQWLRDHQYIPDSVYSSELMRTQQTAKIALKEAGITEPVFPLKIFNEIDYGVDENQTEETVIARIGQDAIKQWDAQAIVPHGWHFDPQECILNWQSFADHIIEDGHECTLVVTSNGIARFAPYLTGNFDEFAKNNKIKLSTGAVAVLQFENDEWSIIDWNVKP